MRSRDNRRLRRRKKGSIEEVRKVRKWDFGKLRGSEVGEVPSEPCSVPETPRPTDEPKTESTEEATPEPVDYRLINLVHLQPADLLTVDVGVSGGSNTVVALVDTGAAISLVRESLVDPASVDGSRAEEIRGLGDRSFKTKGVVTLAIGFHGLILSPSVFRVVEDDILDYPVYLGGESLPR